MENYVPGKLEEMGLGWEDCRKVNERLIYASISGASAPILGVVSATYPLMRVWQDTDRLVLSQRHPDTTSSLKQKLA